MRVASREELTKESEQGIQQHCSSRRRPAEPIKRRARSRRKE
jgi:hypothetical protein